jgi:hypothetical protein
MKRKIHWLPHRLWCRNTQAYQEHDQEKQVAMAISSLIARHNRDGSFDNISVTYGHPGWVGPILVQCYAEDAQVNALLALGLLSHLDREIGVKHSVDRPHRGWCVAFGRDRSEANTEARRSESLSDLVQHARHLFIRHVFVWTMNPETSEKAWATVPMPQETEESVLTLVDAIWQHHLQGGEGPLGIPAESD